jgi:glycine dehydrogenase
VITADEWKLPYSRQKAAYPLSYLHEGYKFWPAVARVNNAAGDRNLICTCPPIESYAESNGVSKNKKKEAELIK